MKRFLFISIVCMILVAFVGCEENSSSSDPSVEASSVGDVSTEKVVSAEEATTSSDKDRFILGTNEIHLTCPADFERVDYRDADLLSLDLTDKDEVYFYHNAYYMYEKWENGTPQSPKEMHYEDIFANFIENDLLEANITYDLDTFTMTFDSTEEDVSVLSQNLVRRTGTISGDTPKHIDEDQKSPDLKFISYTFLQNDSEHANWEDVPVCWMIMSECTDSSTFEEMDNTMKTMLESAKWDK